VFKKSSDNDWEKFGQENPYYGVITDEKYKSNILSLKSKDIFFQSGEDYINDLLSNIKQNIDPNFSIARALDFGCGVGRLLIPLATVANSAVGIDISESMIKEARKNCDERGLSNVEFYLPCESDYLANKFDFIHSFIVFQHIPANRGLKVFKGLLNRLSANGVCAIHFTYSSDSWLKKVVAFIKSNVPYSANLMSLVRGKSLFSPSMQMNSYSLNRVFYLIQKIGVPNFFVEFTNHAGHLGVLVYFRKP
jgi:SAM-dependent methyltransferase